MATPNLPNWTYHTEEIASGLYVLRGVDKRGHLLNSVGIDFDRLEEDFFEAAQKIDLLDDCVQPGLYF
jgi:hypothetical protein